MVGQTISHYKIAAKLGEGGMGVVYKAEDLRLERTVALKFLAPHLLAHQEGRQRFIREAKAAATLDHPNVCTVYEIDEGDGQVFLAMAYIEGQSVKERIEQRPLKLQDAIDIAGQTAQGLKAAHKKGIVHRDIKSANLMVTAEGQVKIMDFGLAHLSDRTKVTETGTRLGTPAYMSPEQARGEEVDQRSDTWSLGVVLYEMISGQLPFKGEREAATLHSILHEEPEPLTALRSGIPVELDRIVHKALAKDPADRYQHVEDLAVDLRATTGQLNLGRFAASSALQKPRIRLLPWIAVSGALLATAGLTWWLTRSLGPAPDGPPQFRLTQLTSDAGLTFEPAISADGKLVAYASDRAGDGGLDIWVQQVSGGGAVRLTDHEADDRSPTFSPDGGRIAFRSERDGGGIYVMPALGGDPKLVGERGLGPRFSPDGNLITYYIGEYPSAKLFVVPADGGVATRLCAEFKGASHPIWLPGGKHLLLSGNHPDHGRDWWVVPVMEGPIVKTGVADRLAEHGLTPGSLLYVMPEAWQVEGNAVVFSARSGGTANLWRIPVSPGSWKVAGPPERLTFGTGTEGEASVALGGRIGFSSLLLNQDVWALPIDPDDPAPIAEPVRLTTNPATDDGPSVSSDGRKLVFRSNRSGDWSLWFKDLDTGKETALTTPNPAHGQWPVISPDGSKVAFTLGQGREASIYVVAVDQRIPQRLCEACGGGPRSWSSDGSTILHQLNEESTIHLLDVANGKRTEILRGSQRSPSSPRFSFDDRWITFMQESQPNRSRVFVVPFQGGSPTAEQDWIAVTSGESSDNKPRWAPDGNSIYFTSTRDGFACIWAIRLDPATKRPVREPSEVRHFHNMRLSMSLYPLAAYALSVARDKLVFELTEITGNIWMLEPTREN